MSTVLSEIGRPIGHVYDGDVRNFGASPSASASAQRAAIQAALDASDRVIFREQYTVDAPVTLSSNQTLEWEGDGEISLESGATTEIITGSSVSNVVLVKPKITGNGAPGFSNVLLTSCSRVRFDHSNITLAGSNGVQLEGCDNITVFDSNLSQNYFNGIWDRDGSHNRFIANRLYQNGNTGVASNTGGRGINLWRCVGDFVSGNAYIANTEYGFRLYSEAADVAQNRGHRIVGEYFEDNVRADLVLYDESLAGTLVRECAISDIEVRRTTVPTLDCSVLVHGGDNTLSKVHVTANGTFGAYTAFLLFGAVRTTLDGCSANNLRDMHRFSDTGPSTDCTISGARGYGVGTGFGPTGLWGSGHVVRDGRFTHAGGGTTDDCIINYNASGRNYIDDNICDGFRYGFYTGEEVVTLRRNKTLNSTGAGWRKDGNAQAGQEVLGNVWDSADPTLLQYLERRAAGNAVLYAGAAPTIRTWAVGDRTYHNAPSAGNPKSWVCTTAGTPGTHTSEGNL